MSYARPEWRHQQSIPEGYRVQASTVRAYPSAFADADHYEYSRSMEDFRVHTIEPASVDMSQQRIIALFDKLKPNPNFSTSGWLFDLKNALVLEADLIVFITRIRDVGRMDLVPNAFSAYTPRAMEGQAWKDVQQRSTKKPPPA
jgi:hypothetical protein